MSQIYSFIRQRPIFLVSLLVIIAGLAYHFWPAGGMPPEQPFVVEVETVAKGPLVKSVKFLARVSSRQEAFLASDMKGTLKGIYVEEGKPVKKGTVMAELDNGELSREYDHAKERVKNAETQYARARQLFEAQTFSKTKLELVHDLMLRAKTEFEQVQKRYTKSQFIAPFDGICGVFKFRPGQTVSEGDIVVSLNDASGFILNIDIPESLLAEVQPGETIHYMDDEAKVASVQHSLDPESHMGIARADVPPTWKLSSGQMVSVFIDVESKNGVISLPRTAIFLKDGNPFVYKIVEGKAELEGVETGLTGKLRVEITEGLNEGDKVILKGQENIWPTRAVKEYVEEKKLSEG